MFDYHKNVQTNKISYKQLLCLLDNLCIIYPFLLKEDILYYIQLSIKEPTSRTTASVLKYTEFINFIKHISMHAQKSNIKLDSPDKCHLKEKNNLSTAKMNRSSQKGSITRKLKLSVKLVNLIKTKAQK